MKKRKMSKSTGAFILMLLVFCLLPIAAFGAPIDKTVVSVVRASAQGIFPIVGTPVGGLDGKPEFTVTQGNPAYFFVDASNGEWQKYNEETDVWETVNSGLFTPGLWRFDTQIRIDGEYAKSWRLSPDCDVYVNGVYWGRFYNGDFAHDTFSYGRIRSPEYYAEQTYRVTVNDSNATHTGEGLYNENDVVILNQGTKEGYDFDYWSVDTENVILNNPENPDHESFSMPAEDVEVTAHWKPWVEINDVNFPDPEFRRFVKSLPGAEDGYFTKDEILNIKEFKDMQPNPKDMKGVEFFTSLETIKIWNLNLEKIDISKNINLKSLSIIQSKISSLDLKNNTELTYLEIGYNSGLKELDVSHNTKLETLKCYGNRVTELDLSALDLKMLICALNPISSIDVGGQTNLTSLNVNSCNLTDLDVSHNTKLETLDVSNDETQMNESTKGNAFKTLDLSENIALKELYAFSVGLTDLNLSNNKNLTFLQCGRNDLTSLDVSCNTALETLSCPYNRLSYIDLSHNNKLKDFYYNNNQFTNVDLSFNAPDITSWGVENMKYVMDQTALSELQGFDADRVLKSQGGNFKNGKVNFDRNSNSINYTYDCGNGQTCDFLLKKAGWDVKDGTWKYINKDGTPITGWSLIDGVWYYFDKSGIMQTGWLNLGDTWFYMQSDGAMTTGWAIVNGTWYYFNGSGYMQTGWLNLGNTWFYMQPDGAMTTGWAIVNGTWYYFNGSGYMQTGWLNLGGTWFYMQPDGAMTTGWEVVNGTWYYFNGSGYMQTGWLNLGDTWFYMQPDGAMTTGWEVVYGSWYYFNGSGYMLTGWQWINGKCYYFYESGAMASNRWIGNSYVDASGAWVA